MSTATLEWSSSQPMASGRSDGPAVLVSQLGKRYRHVRALDAVSFSVQPGEMLAVVGPDGAGKTTLVQLLAGLLEPTEGEATVAGLDLRTAGTALGERIGYMSEGFTLYGSLTVAENLAFFADLYGVRAPERERRIAELLRFSRLEPALNRRARQLSGGMQKKLALCCVLLHQPRALLLDEPTTGVDPLSRQEFWRLLERFLTQGTAIVMTTAYLDEAERCQQAILLHEGRILASGHPDELRRAYGQTLWEVQARPAEAALRILGESYGADRVYLARQALRVASDDQAESPGEVLRAAGIDVAAAHRIEPGLEDLFVSRIAASKPASAEATTTRHATLSQTAHPGGIEADGLTRRFGDVTAVDNVSVRVAPGEVFGLVGPNGSGKSTFIRMLTGLLPASAGRAQVAGLEVARAGQQVRQHVGYMSQRFSLYLDLSVEENVDFFGGLYGLEGRRLAERKAWALDLADLEDAAGMRTSDLGGGFRQRLALAAALLHEPGVVFLDEPTSGVDPIARRRFWNLIYLIARSGTTVLVTTHYLDEAERCDRIGVLDAGRLIATGTPDELKAKALQQSGERLYAVHGPAPVRMLELMASLPEVMQATLHGSAVRIAVAHGVSLERLKAALAQAGVEARVEYAEPSLEDAFTALLRQERNP